MDPIRNSFKKEQLSADLGFAKQIFYKEISFDGNTTQIKSLCASVTKDKDGQIQQNAQVNIASFPTPVKMRNLGETFQRKKAAICDSAFNDSVNNSAEPKLKELGNTEKKKKVVNKSLRNVILTFFIVPILVHGYFYFKGENISSVSPSKLYPMFQNVFGQKEAVSSSLFALDNFEKENFSKLLVFTGGVGVGKSLVSSIISENLPWTSKFLIFPESLSKLFAHVLQSISKAGTHLIIIEDLSLKDITVLQTNILHYIRSLADVKFNSDSKTFLILIFRSRTQSDTDSIIKKLDEHFPSYHHAKFNKLSYDDVKNCYLTEMKRQKINVKAEDVDMVVSKKFKYVNVGCKGVADDVALYFL